MVELEHREQRLKDALAAVDADYDFVLIDCPPALSLLTLNGLCAAHGVIIPMQCEYYALEGLSDLVNTIKKVHANLNTDLKIIGLLRVMFDPRITLSQQVSAQLEAALRRQGVQDHHPAQRAPGRGAVATACRASSFDPASKGAQAYIAFGAEMVERIKINVTQASQKTHHGNQKTQRASAAASKRCSAATPTSPKRCRACRRAVRAAASTQMQAGKYQPRTRMDEGALYELAESIKAQGIMQPILVRPVGRQRRDRYEIIAGERRFRAAQLAGLDESAGAGARRATTRPPPRWR